MSDFLTARLASRAFQSLYHSQQLWASRFANGSGERSWLFEARDFEGSLDWRWIYRRTNRARIGAGLQNRERIWGFIQQIADILNLLPVKPSDPPEFLNKPQRKASAQLFVPPIHSGNLGFVGVGQPQVMLTGPDETLSHFKEGCRLLHKQRACLPGNLSRISISQVAVGKTTYVAGLTLASESGEEVSLGYMRF